MLLATGCTSGPRDAQVRHYDGRVGGEVLSGGAGPHPAAVEHVAAVGDRQGEMERRCRESARAPQRRYALFCSSRRATRDMEYAHSQ